MIKIFFLTLVLLISLPACNSKKKSVSYADSPIEQQVDMFAPVEEERGFLPEEEDVPSFFNFDEDTDELFPSESAEEENFDEESIEVSWVDVQADDEFKKLYFAFNKEGLKAGQEDSVKYNVEQLKQLIADSDTQAHPTIVIEGHACQEGDRNYNIALSEKRAKTIADIFIAAGIDKELVKIVGRGQEMPVVMNGKVVDGSREERAPNRRVEVHVIYT